MKKKSPRSSTNKIRLVHDANDNQNKKESNKYIELNSRNIATIKANRHVHVGVFIYVILAIFIVYNLFQFFTKQAINFVLLEEGTISEDLSFRALIIRDESLVMAPESGPVTFLAPEGHQLSINEPVCIINKNKQIEDLLSDKLSNEKGRLASNFNMKNERSERFKALLTDFKLEYSANDFENIYNLKQKLENSMDNSIFSIDNPDIYNSINRNIKLYKEQIEKVGTIVYSDTSDLILYSYDGMEGINSTNIEISDFQKQSNYRYVSDTTEIKKDQPLYRKVNSLYYHFASKIDSISLKVLDERVGSYISLYFPTKDLSIIVKLEEIRALEDSDDSIAIFLADRYINEFLNDRFLNFKISLFKERGIKIPNSTITDLELAVLPASAVKLNKKNENEIRKLKQVDANNKQEEIIRVKIYLKDNNYVYVRPLDSTKTISVGDEILIEGSNNTKVNEMKKLPGVYVINKGYADFRYVDITYKSEKYSVVKQNIPYSVKLYDKVATNATSINEFDLIE